MNELRMRVSRLTPYDYLSTITQPDARFRVVTRLRDPGDHLTKTGERIQFADAIVCNGETYTDLSECIAALGYNVRGLGRMTGRGWVDGRPSGLVDYRID